MGGGDCACRGGATATGGAGSAPLCITATGRLADALPLAAVRGVGAGRSPPAAARAPASSARGDSNPVEQRVARQRARCGLCTKRAGSAGETPRRNMRMHCRTHLAAGRAGTAPRATASAPAATPAAVLGARPALCDSAAFPYFNQLFSCPGYSVRTPAQKLRRPQALVQTFLRSPPRRSGWRRSCRSLGPSLYGRGKAYT